jgi:hypothetical protein
MLGDSVACGVGCDSLEQALIGQVKKRNNYNTIYNLVLIFFIFFCFVFRFLIP